jgi:integrase
MTIDGQGRRRLKTFPRKKEADAFSPKARVEVREGTHVADSASATVREAGQLWLARAKAAGLERSTVTGYTQQLAYHIEPFIGSRRLSQLHSPAVRAFEDRLREEGRSAPMVRRVMKTLGSILADAQERGLVARNAAKDLRGRRRRGASSEKRQRGKLKVGVDIPTPEEIRAIIEHLTGRWRLFLTAIFTGLRVSELRGLRWKDVDLEARELHVRQRADRHNQIGPPKSEAGERTVPLPALLVNALMEWQPICPKGTAGLVFPTGAGKVEGLGNIINRGLKPVQIAAGVVVPESSCLENSGPPKVRAKYTGFHALRHFYASWCINHRAVIFSPNAGRVGGGGFGWATGKQNGSNEAQCRPQRAMLHRAPLVPGLRRWR